MTNHDHTKLLQCASHALRSYQFGNSAPYLAEKTANDIDAALTALQQPNPSAACSADTVPVSADGSTGWRFRARKAEAECTRLEALINNPHTADFLEAVKLEAAHQRERWGDAHDRSKSAENWFWLVGYLSGKCLRAVIMGDHFKALHHTISSAAALANWHEAIIRDTTGSGAGEDADLSRLDLGQPQHAPAQKAAA